MRQAWQTLYTASESAVNELHDDQKNATALRPPPPRESFDQTISSLRQLLGLEKKLGGELDPNDGPEPDVHVLGYSLGGFMAQSVFMSWPFLIGSCSTLLSGGALRELAPTAFADPEEWQTVLHSLRYELDDAMLRGRYQFESQRDGRIEQGQVSGIEFDLFLFLKSTFYEVFQQEYRGSFQTRLASFRRRMLFVVGGNDPIVRPQSVLDSGPPDGINMLTVGGMGHFLEGRSRDEEEEQQRSFWLPQIGELVDTLANEAAEKLRENRSENWLDADWSLPTRPPSESGPLNAAERMAVDGNGALPASLFQRCLDDLLIRASTRSGILFILRNEVPTVLLDDGAIQQLAAGLHHDDAGITDYIEGLRRRRDLILANPDRVSLILPWNARTITEQMDAHPGHPSQSEGAGGQIPKRIQPSDVWKRFSERCEQVVKESPYAVRVCDGRRGVGELSGLPELDTAALASAARKRLRVSDDESHPVTPSLPDCWVWMSRKFLDLKRDKKLTVEVGRKRLCEVVSQKYGDEDALSKRLQKDQLRIVTVSRSRYNPRFRGRLVVDPRVAKTLLLHISLCIAVSVPFDNYDLDRQTLRALSPL
jgi:pimeloyl-ACP methyl ester carboxylesterase